MSLQVCIARDAGATATVVGAVDYIGQRLRGNPKKI